MTMTTMMMKESRVGECKSRSKESLPTLFLSLVGCDHVLDAVLVRKGGTRRTRRKTSTSSL
jgi:hypothetical protein